MKIIIKIWFFFFTLFLSQDHWETAIFADDIMGRQVKTFVMPDQIVGSGSIQWNGTNDYDQRVSSGLYLYTIQAGNFRGTKKMVILE